MDAGETGDVGESLKTFPGGAGFPTETTSQR